jgi:hypothetical protein
MRVPSKNWFKRNTEHIYIEFLSRFTTSSSICTRIYSHYYYIVKTQIFQVSGMALLSPKETNYSKQPLPQVPRDRVDCCNSQWVAREPT